MLFMNFMVDFSQVLQEAGLLFMLMMRKLRLREVKLSMRCKLTQRAGTQLNVFKSYPLSHYSSLPPCSNHWACSQFCKVALCLGHWSKPSINLCWIFLIHLMYAKSRTRLSNWTELNVCGCVFIVLWDTQSWNHSSVLYRARVDLGPLNHVAQ